MTDGRAPRRRLAGLNGVLLAGALAVTTLRGPEFLTGDYGFEASWLTGGVEAVVLAALLVVGPRLAGGPESQKAREYYRGRTPAVAAGPEPPAIVGSGERPSPPPP